MSCEREKDSIFKLVAFEAENYLEYLRQIMLEQKVAYFQLFLMFELN